MSRFAELLPFNTSETVVSYLSRLAAALDYDQARQFGRDVGVNFQKLAVGDRAAVEAFSEMLECKQSSLTPGVVTTSEIDRSHIICGERLSHSLVNRDPMRFCPHCVIEDEVSLQGRRGHRAYGRIHWLVDAIRVCPVHSTKLIWLPKIGKPMFTHDFAAHLREALRDLPSLTKKAGPADQGTLDRYVRSRLAGEPVGSEWLRQFPLYAIIKIAEFTGVVVRNGVSASVRDLSEEEKAASHTEGFDILDAGEQAYARFLRNFARRSAEGHSRYGGGILFGPLYYFLNQEHRDRNYDIFRSIMKTVVEEVLPVGPENRLFGEQPTRRVHSIYSAANTYKIHYKRLKKLLVDSGQVAEDAWDVPPHQIHLRPENVAMYMAEIADSVSVPKARELLGANRMQMQVLIAHQYIVPHAVSGKDRRRTPIHGTVRRFTMKAIQEFLGKIAGLETTISDGLFDIETASRRANCRTDEIFKLLFDGALEKVALDPTRCGIGAVLVDPNELKGKTILEYHGCLTIREASYAIPTSYRVVKSLIENGHLASVQRQNPVKRLMQTVIEPNEIERFKADYVTPNEFAKSRKIAMCNLKQALKAYRPAFDPDAVAGLFYRRRDLGM